MLGEPICFFLLKKTRRSDLGQDEAVPAKLVHRWEGPEHIACLVISVWAEEMAVCYAKAT